MSKESFDEDCVDCRIVVADPQTMKPLPEDHPVMQACGRVWETLSTEQRKDFHAFTCLNSREPKVLETVRTIQQLIQAAISPS